MTYEQFTAVILVGLVALQFLSEWRFRLICGILENLADRAGIPDEPEESWRSEEAHR